MKVLPLTTIDLLLFCDRFFRKWTKYYFRNDHGEGKLQPHLSSQDPSQELLLLFLFSNQRLYNQYA